MARLSLPGTPMSFAQDVLTDRTLALGCSQKRKCCAEHLRLTVLVTLGISAASSSHLHLRASWWNNCLDGHLEMCCLGLEEEEGRR